MAIKGYLSLNTYTNEKRRRITRIRRLRFGLGPVRPVVDQSVPVPEEPSPFDAAAITTRTLMPPTTARSVVPWVETNGSVAVARGLRKGRNRQRGQQSSGDHQFLHIAPIGTLVAQRLPLSPGESQRKIVKNLPSGEIMPIPARCRRRPATRPRCRAADRRRPRARSSGESAPG